MAFTKFVNYHAARKTQRSFQFLGEFDQGNLVHVSINADLGNFVYERGFTHTRSGRRR